MHYVENLKHMSSKSAKELLTKIEIILKAEIQLVVGIKGRI